MGKADGFAFKRPAFPTADFGGDCTFSLLTTLVSPQLKALSAVSAGQILYLSINNEKNALSALNEAGELCGLITPRFTRFISCMAKGIVFEAIVVSINGPACSALVQNKS